MQGPAGAARLLRTVRYLKPVQIYGRALTRLPGRRPDPAPAPPLRPLRGTWVPPVERQHSLLERWRVRFLNEDGEIARPEQWNDAGKPKLWLYNLHYFDELCASYDAGRRALQCELVTRWIAENPPGPGNGWEPYPVSVRIGNWIKWALNGQTLEPRWCDSLAMQVRWLERHVEWHLLGNHLMANAKALLLAGLFFDGPEAERWLDMGFKIHERELPEQILADGAHFELSPMYHAIILEDLLDLINAARTYGYAGAQVFRDLSGVTASMRRWLAAMTHPDGGPSFFNDAAFGIAASRADLEAYAARLGLPAVAEPGEGVHHLAASGYVRVNRGKLAAILDLARVGPDYIPGHAHADTLSFELSLGGERIIVNGGTSIYAAGPLRQAQRSTRAHSTVEVAGADSSEMWASFRVGRRARVQGVSVDAGNAHAVVTGSHDGYRHLPGRPVHRRTWRFADSTLTIVDEVAGAVEHSRIARFHLAPAIVARVGPGGLEGQLRTPYNRSIAWKTSSPGGVELGNWYPEFGKTVCNAVLAVPFGSGPLVTTFDIETVG